MDVTQNSDIGALIREAENNYIHGEVHLSKYVSRSMYEDLNTIDAYLNSKHISGEFDSQDREKPFFNIVIAARNIWYRATDIDRKDIRFKATKKEDYLLSFLATAKLQDLMRKEQFGQFLNDWGLSLASYGSSVVKFIENSSGLHKLVVPWSKLICDAIDFENNPVIEILELTPAQLRQNESYDQDLVEKLIAAQTTRKTLDQQKKDNKADYIKLYEIHGKLPKSFLTGKEKDEREYVQQMQVVSFVASKEKGEFDDYTLFKAKEKKNPYMITHLIKQEGQTLSIGAVQNLFQAQWMKNHEIKTVKDYLDAISKVVWQTADPNYANKNVLADIENGFIAVHKENMPLTRVEHGTADITGWQNFGVQWQNLGNEMNSTPESIKGINPPSNQPLGTTEILTMQGTSLFEQMVENKGLYIEQMMREYIIPYLKKQLDTQEEIVATLEDYGIDEIDQAYIPSEAAKRFNRKAVEAVIKRGEIRLSGGNENDIQLPDYTQEQQGVAQELNVSGTRFFNPSEADDEMWKDIMDGFDWDSLEVEVTNEQGDKTTILTTLNKLFTDIASTNGAILQNEDARMLFNLILEETGRLSPLQFKKPAVPMVAGSPAVNQPQ